jgi:hypothetical protein
MAGVLGVDDHDLGFLEGAHGPGRCVQAEAIPGSGVFASDDM